MDNLKLLQAIHFASQKHKEQKRKGEDKAPYINHPIDVATLIAEVGGIEDIDVLIAALLHDTIEDTDTTPEDIERIFGKRVADIVLEVTDDKSLPKTERRRLQIAHAAHLSREATLIKLADKISNVKDVTYSPPKKWSISRRREYLDWAEKVVNNCSNHNSNLKQRFYEIIEAGRGALSEEQGLGV